jgi:uncharacterized damage-inducible protein DinB
MKELSMSDELKQQLDALAAFPAQLKAHLAQQSEAALRFQPAPEEWSVVEVLGHLIEIDAIWLGRIRQALSTDNPTLVPADNNVVRQRDYQNKQLGFLHITFAERREELLEMLRILRPAQLERTAQHPRYGQMTIAQMVAGIANHDQIHLEQINNNLAAFK